MLRRQGGLVDRMPHSSRSVLLPPRAGQRIRLSCWKVADHLPFEIRFLLVFVVVDVMCRCCCSNETDTEQRSLYRNSAVGSELVPAAAVDSGVERARTLQEQLGDINSGGVA